MPEKVLIPASDWPEKCFCGQSAKSIYPDTFVPSYTELFSLSISILVFFVQRADKFYREFKNFFSSKMSMHWLYLVRRKFLFFLVFLRLVHCFVD